MRMLILVLTGIGILASCATSNVQESSKSEAKSVKNAAEQAQIQQAVENRRFIIKFDRLYNSYGGMVELIPKANYIILDGDRVVISAAYVGRQYNYRPIKGIDMVGRAVTFELKNNTSRGLYEIRMKVKNDKNSFDVFLTISKDGYCNTALTSYRIDHVRYTGNFIPLIPKEPRAVPEDMLL